MNEYESEVAHSGNGINTSKTTALRPIWQFARDTIPANIAEGFGKRSRAEKARFLNIAEGSLEECRYYLILAHDLGYGQTESLTSILDETSRLLNAYARAILASGS
jgi:four helix bundle protein